MAKISAISVLGESGNLEAIPLLIPFVTEYLGNFIANLPRYQDV
ncbi:MAG: hypothetical protein ACTMUP_09430 [cyanobacterium endosymbiont of Rhopalodia musculus]